MMMTGYDDRQNNSPALGCEALVPDKGAVINDANLDEKMMDITDLLRDPERRNDVLLSLVASMTPEDINPTPWRQWLAGGPGPFQRAKLEQPDPGGQKIQRALDRKSSKVSKDKRGVHDAKRTLEAAQRKLAEAERKLANSRAEDAALIQYVVNNHLLKIMAPMFAMGPAWTVMRVISAYYPPILLEEQLEFFRSPEKRANKEQQLRHERREETNRMLEMLDHWSGDLDFEYALREAIAEVTGRYAKRERKGWSVRTDKAMATTLADPELGRDRDEIIDGMKRNHT